VDAFLVLCYTEIRLSFKMAKHKEAYIVAMMRSPVAREMNLSPQELARQVLQRLFLINHLNPKLTDFFAVGSAISLLNSRQAKAKEIALLSGMENADCEFVEKACSSGLVAGYRAAQSIWHEGADFAIGGGLEIMSAVREETAEALTDHLCEKKMYQLADEAAVALGISKEEHDKYSAESYRRALENLYNTGPYLTAILASGENLQFAYTYDEIVKAHESFADFEKVSRKKPLDGCNVITYASSSKPGDGAAFIAFASPRFVKTNKLRPLARFVAFARDSGSDPKSFVTRPVGAARKLLEKTRTPWDKIDVASVNEAFATTPLYWMRETGMPHEKVNPRGGAIALGHPLGMSGARIIGEAVHILNQENKNIALVAVCNARDEGTAAEIHRV